MVTGNEDKYAKDINTFADNFAESLNEMCELLISSAIWERKDVDPDTPVKLNKQVHRPKEGVVAESYFLAGELILVVYVSSGKSQPMEYTFYTYE